MSLPDPRFETLYSSNYKGPLFWKNASQQPSTVSIPSFALEKWCEPGYQPTRPNKGVKLTVNDYPFHNIQYGGGLWPTVVYTDLDTPN
ncbi:MAG TPA: hypothetical protein PKD85_01065 [Saprospiraceae bacterium]|nr:hypothetical protein [Saprospiraceae bacterium]